MGNIFSTGLAILAVATGAMTIWVTLRLANRRHDRNSGEFGRWLLHNAANSMKRAGIQPITGKFKLIQRVGLALMSVGLLLILSVFGTLIASFGTLGNYEGPVQAAVFRAFGGLIVTMLGRFLLYMAAHGWSGFGFVSRAELARIDAEQRQATIVQPVGTAAWDIDAVARFEEHRK